METFSALSLISIFLLQTLSGAYSTTLTITNNCDDIIWPAILPNPGSQLLLSPSGFALSPGDSKTLPGPVPSDWSGRVWARTQCATSPTGAFLCATGDCGTSTVDCSGSGAGAGQPTPPATVAEFSPGALSVSVVDGYNLPIVVSAGACGTASCVINSGAVYYPPELRASGSGAGNESVGIKSACSAFNEAEYCCTGNYSSASSCKANSYSELFKKWCPQARTYAYDTVGTTFACESADYVVNFCSPANFVFPSTDGTRSGGDRGDDGNIYGNKKLDAKFGIIVGVAAAILGAILILFFWRRYWKAECEFGPCTCTFCSIFTCSCCMDDDHSGKC